MLRAEIPLTLNDSVHEVTDRNPELLAAQETLKAAEANFGAAASDYFPQLSGTMGTARGGSSGGVGSTPATTVNSAGLDLRQNLFDGFKTISAREEAAANVDAVRADLAVLKSRLSQELVSAFADLHYAQESRRLARAILERRKANLDLVQLRYEGGREHKGSYLRIKAAHRSAGFDVDRAERSVLAARSVLVRVLGRDFNDELVAAEPVSVAPTPQSPDLVQITDETPEMRRAAAARIGSAARERSARGDFLPSLDASLSQRWSEDRWWPGDKSWTGGVSLSLPIFTGGSTHYNWKSAQAERRRREALFRDTRSSVYVSLRSALNNFQNAVQAVEVQAEFLEAAKVRATIARSQYTSGLLKFEDWDLIENDLIDNEKQWLSDQRDAVRAQTAWDRARGKGVIP